MPSEWLSTVECAKLINQAVGVDDGVGPWYIRDAIRRGELVARVHHEPKDFRRRARFRVHVQDFETFVRKTSAALAPAIIAALNARGTKAA